MSLPSDDCLYCHLYFGLLRCMSCTILESIGEEKSLMKFAICPEPLSRILCWLDLASSSIVIGNLANVGYLKCHAVSKAHQITQSNRLFTIYSYIRTPLLPMTCPVIAPTFPTYYQYSLFSAIEKCTSRDWVSLFAIALLGFGGNAMIHFLD